MKLCPFCAEEIQDEAIKCRHCHEFVDGRPRSVASAAAPVVERTPWYFSGGFIAMMFLTLPPLVLPLVWLHPKMPLLAKMAITLAVAGFCWISYRAIHGFVHQFDEATRMWQQSPL